VQAQFVSLKFLDQRWVFQFGRSQFQGRTKDVVLIGDAGQQPQTGRGNLGGFGHLARHPQ